MTIGKTLYYRRLTSESCLYHSERREESIITASRSDTSNTHIAIYSYDLKVSSGDGI